MTFKSKARRAGWLLVVAAFALGIFSAVLPQKTDAYSLISDRYIRLSTSEISATNVIYSVGFEAESGLSVGTMVVRFCEDNPIIGDICDVPLGFNTNFASLGNPQSQVGVTDWVLQTGGGTSDSNELLFTRTGGAQVIAANTDITFNLGNGSTTGITNPSTTNTTFFARIMLFASAAASMPVVANDDNNSTDAGGVALSTANVLNVTAKVQESLTFCLYTLANCAAGGDAVLLGDANNVLAQTNLTYLDATPKFDLASNALGGVIVRIKGPTLTSGAFTITANGNACTADSVTTSVEQFGVRVVTYGAGQAAPSAGRYDCLAGNHMFDPTVTNTTYGDPFVATTGATDVSTTNFELSAKAANTTEAGVYTAKLVFIATATY